MARFRPAFGRTYVPGASPGRVPRRVHGALGRAGHVAHPQVLDPDQVEAPGEVGGQLAHPVLAGVGPAGVPASQPGLDPPAAVAAPLGPAQPALGAADLRIEGVVSNRHSSPVDSAAATATPRSAPTTSPVPGAGMAAGMAANAMCQRPAQSRVTR